MNWTPRLVEVRSGTRPRVAGPGPFSHDPRRALPVLYSTLAGSIRDFAATHPDIAAEWHPSRNGDKRPDQFTFGSHHEAWWQCPTIKTHVYQARISSRT